MTKAELIEALADAPDDAFMMSANMRHITRVVVRSTEGGHTIRNGVGVTDIVILSDEPE